MNADTVLLDRIDSAYAFVAPSEFAGAAEVEAETASRILDAARMYAAGARRRDVADPATVASLLRRMAERVRPWAPNALFFGLLQAADRVVGTR